MRGWIIAAAMLGSLLASACTPLAEQYPPPWTSSNYDVRKALDESKVWCDRYKARESKSGGAWIAYCTNDKGQHWIPYRIQGDPFWTARRSEPFDGVPP